jgi:hypothetical protein
MLTATLCFLLFFVAYSRSAQICCNNIGCFTDDPPFDGQPLPQCIETMNPVYTMYTRSNRNVGQVFSHTSVPSVFGRSRRTVFIAHGWQSSGDTEWLHSMKDAFLDKEDMNVAIVDWRGGAELLNYPQSAANTRSMGAYTALVYENLISSGGGSNTLMWCTGHSLGAHMCGHAGMRTTLQRVTGMDPAGPWFEGSIDRTVGLNPTSARLVDVIHTDTTYGTLRDLGHIDFYPAGGHDQPGCVDLLDETPETKGDLGCSHGRAHVYMLQSIKSNCFLSRQKCSNYNNLPGSCVSCTCGTSACAAMGYGADNGCNKSGWFYLSVTSTDPYCVG